MPFEKLAYIKKQIAKTNKKDYENYVVTRIIHGVNDLDAKFVTQQLVLRPNGHALIDLYLPQINYLIEVDEPYHEKNVEADCVRDRDVVSAIGKSPRRIRIEGKSLEQLNADIDSVVEEIRSEIQNQRNSGKFFAWDPARELDPLTWIEKGEIHLDDKVAFRTHADACRCMGLNYKQYMRGAAKHPHEELTDIWFPKLYKNGLWENEFDAEAGIIYERAERKEERAEHAKKCLASKRKRRIAFAHVKDNLGEVRYRFRGVFVLDQSKTSPAKGVVWLRNSMSAKTYDYRE